MILLGKGLSDEQNLIKILGSISGWDFEDEVGLDCGVEFSGYSRLRILKLFIFQHEVWQKRQFLLRGHSALEFVVPLAMFKRCVQSFCEPAQPPGEVCGYEEAGWEEEQGVVEEAPWLLGRPHQLAVQPALLSGVQTIDNIVLLPKFFCLASLGRPSKTT